MSKPGIKFLLWDFDGTLAFREGLWTGTIMSVLKKNNFEYIQKPLVRPFLSIGFPWNSPDSGHALIFNGKTWWEYMETYFAEVFRLSGLDEETSERLSKQVRSEYLDVNCWHIFDDTSFTLQDSIRRGYRNIILSNHIPELEVIVSQLGLSQYFDAVFSSANIGFDKPNRKIFEHVMSALNTAPHNCLMIGDNYQADIAGALRSGIKAVYVRKANEKFYKYYTKDLQDIHSIIHELDVIDQ